MYGDSKSHVRDQGIQGRDADSDKAIELPYKCMTHSH